MDQNHQTPVASNHQNLQEPDSSDEDEELLDLGQQYFQSLKDGSVERKVKLKALMLENLSGKKKPTNSINDSINDKQSSPSSGVLPTTTAATELPSSAEVNTSAQKDIHGGASRSVSEIQTRSYVDAFNGVQSTSADSNEREKVSPWASLFKDTDLNLRFIPPTMVEGKPEVHISTSQLQGVKDMNSKLVVGNFIGKKSSFSYVRACAEQFWETKDFTMRTQGEMFTFDFKDAEIRAKVLDKGSFFIASCVFYIRPWRLFVEQDIKELSTVPIWVLFEGFPIELWDKEGFSRVGSAIGTPLFLDSHTAQKKSTNYARMCIEIEAAKELPEDITVVVDQRKAFKLAPKYKWKPASCSKCKVFGHGDSYCPNNQRKVSKAWVKTGSVAAKPVVIAAEDSPNSTNLPTSKDTQENAQEKGDQTMGRPAVEKTSSSTATPKGAWQIPGKKHTAKRGFQFDKRAGKNVVEASLSSKATALPAAIPAATSSLATPTTPATTATSQPQGQSNKNMEETPMSSIRGPARAANVQTSNAPNKTPKVTPFKGLIPSRTQSGSQLEVQPVAEPSANPKFKKGETNPYVIKKGDNLSFEEELEVHRKARQWEEQRKKASTSVEKQPEPSEKMGASPSKSPRRSTRAVASPPRK
ncbi:hypothetical protein ACHQM5_009837 [Ranunculus cassubicifolius]